MRRLGLTYGEYASVIAWLMDVRHQLTCWVCRINAPYVSGEWPNG